MGSKEYQKGYYLKNKHKRKTREYPLEYQSDYCLKNRDRILLIRAEYYINKLKERSKIKTIMI